MPVTLPKPRERVTSIFSRIIDAANGKMTPTVARYVLSLTFTESDRKRMADLADRNQLGELDRIEKEELEEYVRTGHLLALLQGKARQSVKSKA